MKTKKHKKLKVALISLATFLILLCGGFYIYTLDYYRADDTAVTAMGVSDITTESAGSDIILYPPEDRDLKTALIFYPGGKVEYTAYMPLLEQLARQGLTCVLVRMPFNLAVFDIGAAESIYPLLPEIEHWLVGGHSLGGAMASSYAGNNVDKISGLILLGAYPVNDAVLPTLAVYGSEDIMLDKEKLTGLENVLEIPGGNHAQFGNYGVQDGDGTAAISREDQQKQTVTTIITFIETIINK